MNSVQLRNANGDKIYPIVGRLGETWITVNNDIPDNGIPYFGQVITNGKVLYKDLWDYVSNRHRVLPTADGQTSEQRWQEIAQYRDGDCPYYADLGGNDFRMPRITHWLRAGDITKGYDFYNEELPNIRGTGNILTASGAGIFRNVSGAFKSSAWDATYKTYGLALPNAEQNKESSKIIFNASDSNDIYKDGAHVQPASNVITLGVYATDIVTGLGSIEANEISRKLTAIDNKFNTMGIVESGDGFMRFGNGTQICYGLIIVPAENIEYFDRGILQQIRVNMLFSFAKPFKVKPSLSLLNRGDGDSMYAALIGAHYNTQELAAFSLFDAVEHTGTTPLTLSYIAIGTWK